MAQSEFDRYHDIGGRIEDPPQPIDRRERALFQWERQCAAMRVLLGEGGTGRAYLLVPLDELRDTFETFGASLYNELSFFERMLKSMTLILLRKGVFAEQQLLETESRLRARAQAEPGWFAGLANREKDPHAKSPGLERDPYGGNGYLPVADSPPSAAEWRTRALADLLVELGLLSFESIRIGIERIEAPEPAWGARIVARAWIDSAFRQAILEDGQVACEAFGIPFRDGRLAIVENTDAVHCVVVCTLCSCYPRNLLGQPPAWYVSKPYRSRAIREPRLVLGEFGLNLPPDVAVHVYDSTAELRYMVLPQRPPGTEGLDEQSLAELVTRDCLLGVAVPRVPVRPAG